MKKLILQTVILSALLLTSIITIAQTESELKQKIEKLNKDMADAMIAGDHEKNMALYTNDVVSLPSYDKMIQGKEALRKANEEMIASGWKVKDFKTETFSVEANGSIITEIGTYKIVMQMPGMDEPMTDMGKYLTMWEKQADGSLKIKTEMWNTDKNPMENMAGMEKDDKKNMMGEGDKQRKKDKSMDKGDNVENMPKEDDIK